MSVKEVGDVADTGIFAEIDDCENAVRPTEGAVIRVSGAISFANFQDLFDRLTKRVSKLAPEDRRVVVLDLSGVAYADQTGAKALDAWIKADKQGLRMVAASTGKGDIESTKELSSPSPQGVQLNRGL